MPLFSCFSWPVALRGSALVGHEESTAPTKTVAHVDRVKNGLAHGHPERGRLRSEDGVRRSGGPEQGRPTVLGKTRQRHTAKRVKIERLSATSREVIQQVNLLSKKDRLYVAGAKTTGTTRLNWEDELALDAVTRYYETLDVSLARLVCGTLCEEGYDVTLTESPFSRLARELLRDRADMLEPLIALLQCREDSGGTDLCVAWMGATERDATADGDVSALKAILNCNQEHVILTEGLTGMILALVTTSSSYVREYGQRGDLDVADDTGEGIEVQDIHTRKLTLGGCGQSPRRTARLESGVAEKAGVG